MTQKEFNETNWHRGNVVKLMNGKEYLMKGTKAHGKYLLLYSHEYDAHFVADYRIVDSRTSDYEEPEEVYLEKKRQRQEAAQARLEAERQERLRLKEERKQRNLERQQRIHEEALARKAAKAAERAAQKNAPKPAPTPAVKAKPAVAEPVAAKPSPKPEPATSSSPKRKRIRVNLVEKIKF